MQQQCDYIEKLTIRLDNKQPVEVTDFVESISAFQKEYRNVCKREGLEYNGDAKLYIQVREGSIEWEFVRKVGQLWLFGAHTWLLQKTFELLVGKIIGRIIDGKEPENKNLKTLQNARNFIAVQKGNKGSNMSIRHVKQSDNYKDCTIIKDCTININSKSAKTVIDTLEDKIKSEKKTNKKIFKTILLRLDTASKENDNKGIIEGDGFDSSKSIKLSFDKPKLKNEIIADQKKPLRMCYLADVEVIKTQNKIVFYHIKKIYEKNQIES